MITIIPALMILGVLRGSPNHSQTFQDPAQGAPVTTRTDEWKQKRAEKSEHLTPYIPKKMDRRLANFEKKGFKESLGVRFGDFYANVGGITTGAGLFPGTLRYFKANLFDSPLDISAGVGYTIKGYSFYNFQFGNILRKSPELFLRYSGSGGYSLFEHTKETEGNYYLYGEVMYRYFPEEDFFGLGNDSNEDNKTDYRINGTSYDGVAGLKLPNNFGAFAKVGYIHPHIGPGTDGTTPGTEELFDETTAPGLSTQPSFMRASGNFFLDYRDVPGNPKHGGMYTFTYARYVDLDEGDFSFRRFSYDLRQYLPLGSEQRILAIRHYSSFDDAKGDATVPFYLMQSLGGSDSIRGFDEFRFRDKNLTFLSVEYRWFPHPIVQFCLFYDTGKVFSDVADFDLNDLHRGVGIGMRLMSKKSTILRFDVGHSEEGTSLYFKLNASF